jgi:hypothetical protein
LLQYRRRLDDFDFDIVVQRFGFSGTPGDTLRAFFTSRSAGMRGTRNVGGIADPVIDSLVETVIAANTRAELIIACKALDRVIRSGRYWCRTGTNPRIGSHTGMRSAGPRHSRDTRSPSRKPGGPALAPRTPLREEQQMHIPNLALRIIILICLALVCPTSVLAQERLAFSVSAENTKYTQQHTIDVGDVVGHQVRLFEIKRVYSANAPVIGGLKIVESWTRGISDYTNNTGEAVAYGVYVLDNGDNTRGRLVAFQSPEARNMSATTVGPIIGGTGKLARINGMARMVTLANPQTGMNETRIELEYWLPQ